MTLVAEHFWFAVGSPWQVEALAAFDSPRPLTVWLKLDSGMHRLGLDVDSFRAAHARSSALPHVERVVLMTHLARADELDSERTHEQAATFARAIDGLAGETSVQLACAAGWPDVRSDWVRPPDAVRRQPLPDNTVLTERLRPVMTMQSKVIAERWIEAGEPGYGARFVAARTRVGVVALGYADGYPQFAPNGTPVLIDGQPGALIGRVSMDMLTVDLTAHAQAGIGSVVELWGSAPTLSELAPRCGVSAYQLPCAVKRVAKVYVAPSPRSAPVAADPIGAVNACRPRSTPAGGPNARRSPDWPAGATQSSIRRFVAQWIAVALQSHVVQVAGIAEARIALADNTAAGILQRTAG